MKERLEANILDIYILSGEPDPEGDADGVARSERVHGRTERRESGSLLEASGYKGFLTRAEYPALGQRDADGRERNSAPSPTRAC